MKRRKLLFLSILFIICICCTAYFIHNKNSAAAAQRVVLLIDSSAEMDCTEIIAEDCRDGCADYCKDTGTILYVNTENQIIEKSIYGEEQTIEIEGIELTETVSNVQYSPDAGSIYFIYEGKIYQYSINDKTLTKKTDGIASSWRKTYLWQDNESGCKLIDNGECSELYYINTKSGSEQRVCTEWIQSIGQVQGNKIYALEVYANAQHDSSTVDLRNRIIEINLSDGSTETLQELGNWMQGNYLFACNEENLVYVQIKGQKENVYRINLSTGAKKKIYSTRNTVVGLAVN